MEILLVIRLIIYYVYLSNRQMQRQLLYLWYSKGAEVMANGKTATNSAYSTGAIVMSKLKDGCYTHYILQILK